MTTNDLLAARPIAFAFFGLNELYIPTTVANLALDRVGQKKRSAGM
jgi:hypothetical protein